MPLTWLETAMLKREYIDRLSFKQSSWFQHSKQKNPWSFQWDHVICYCWNLLTFEVITWCCDHVMFITISTCHSRLWICSFVFLLSLVSCHENCSDSQFWLRTKGKRGWIKTIPDLSQKYKNGVTTKVSLIYTQGRAKWIQQKNVFHADKTPNLLVISVKPCWLC